MDAAKLVILNFGMDKRIRISDNRNREDVDPGFRYPDQCSCDFGRIPVSTDLVQILLYYDVPETLEKVLR